MRLSSPLLSSHSSPSSLSLPSSSSSITNMNPSSSTSLSQTRTSRRRPPKTTSCCFLKNILVTLLLATLIPLATGQNGLCPSMCNCIWRNGKQTSMCERQGLIAIPTGITSSTQVLNLTGNNFQILPSRVFQERGLINLQKIFLAECKLGEIAKDAFVQLTNLVELDLSGNLLTSVPTLALSEARSLRRLLLNSNPIRIIKPDAFNHLNNLVFLDLSSSQLDLLEPHAFRGLSKLQFLKLEGNRLQTMAPTVVADLPALYSLDLHQNQWNCDCELRPAREWMVRYNVPQSVPPTCATPQRLAGAMWNSIEIDEFACAPQFQIKTTDLTQYIGNNVSVTCTVSGTPEPVITWLSSDGARNYTVLAGDRISINKERVGSLNTVSSVLTVVNVDLEDTQHFVCAAENRGGIAYKNFTLTILPIPTPSPSTGWAKVEVAGALVGLVFVFVLVLILVMVILLRARRTSAVHGMHLPKLAPIDVLQNVEDRKLHGNGNPHSTLSINKPEIAIICSTSTQIKDPDKGKDSNGSSSGYGSGLMTPDVAKTTLTNSNSSYHLTNGGGRVNLVTTVGPNYYQRQLHNQDDFVYPTNNYHNYQDVYDDHLNLPPPPPPDDGDSYKNFDPIAFDNYPHCYTNAAMNLNQNHQPGDTVQQRVAAGWTELDVHKLMVQPAIVRYSPELANNTNNSRHNNNQDFGLAGTQV